MHSGSNIHYDFDGRHKGISNGGIGAIHLMNRKLGIVEEIDDVLQLLKRHLPYHESDHVLNIAYNVNDDDTVWVCVPNLLPAEGGRKELRPRYGI